MLLAYQLESNNFQGFCFGLVSILWFFFSFKGNWFQFWFSNLRGSFKKKIEF